MFARMNSETPSLSRVAIRQWALTLACLLAGAGIAIPAERPTPVSADCVARAVKLITLIEERGEAQDVAGERLAEAFFTMQQARRLCAEHRIAEGLAMYDSVLLDRAFAHTTGAEVK